MSDESRSVRVEDLSEEEVAAIRDATPPVTGEVGELVERLEDEAQRLHGRGIDRGCVDSSLAGNLALEAAAMLERYAAENARLSKCASCGEPLSRDCQTCRRDWAS